MSGDPRQRRLCSGHRHSSQTRVDSDPGNGFGEVFEVSKTKGYTYTIRFSGKVQGTPLELGECLEEYGEEGVDVLGSIFGSLNSLPIVGIREANADSAMRGQFQLGGLTTQCDGSRLI